MRSPTAPATRSAPNATPPALCDHAAAQLWLGDLNVAVENIDIYEPVRSRNKVPGFTDAERDNFRALLGAGWVDTYRRQHPTLAQYSYWGYRFSMREKNSGACMVAFVVA